VACERVKLTYRTVQKNVHIESSSSTVEVESKYKEITETILMFVTLLQGIG